MDEEELFELEYGDDFDALRELEEELNDEPVKSKSCKTLDFSTPGSKTSSETIKKFDRSKVDNQENIPEESPEDSVATPLNNSLNQSFGFVDVGKKRSASVQDVESSSGDTDLDTQFNLFKKKKPNTCAVEDESELQNNNVQQINILKQYQLETKAHLEPHSEPISRPNGVTSKLNTRNRRKGCVSRSVPLTSDFFSVMTSEGRRAYVTVRSQQSLDLESQRINAASRSIALLNIPIYALRLQLSENERNKNNRYPEIQDNNRIEADLMDEGGSTRLEEDRRQCSRLWVDEYAPGQYTELISEEATNRMLLRWLKLWDHVVFGVDVKDSAAKSSQNDKSSAAQHLRDKKFDPKSQKFFGDDFFELDKNNTPQYKVALVSGPPGLGKTTLAHIIARHAGYNVVEMNASDDRTVEAFKEKILSATQMKSVLGSNPRPNCLIIDEIDGAIQPAVNVLLQLIKAGQTPLPETTKQTKKKTQADTLQRPIICICNDLYATSLRQIRQVALSVTFHTSSSSSVRLASRLLEISKREGLKTEMTTLMALCDKTDSDIRSCINTLQFSKARRGELSLQMVHSMSLGHKDVQKTLFNAWQQIFTMPKAKKQRWINPYDRAENADQAQQLSELLSQSETSNKARFRNILQVAYATGDDNKIQQGLFENYLEVKVKDPHMTLLVKSLNWLCMADVINRSVAHSQDYSLCAYLPFVPVTFHLLFATTHPPKIIYPHSQYEVLTKTTSAESLMSAMLCDMAPSVRSVMTQRLLVLELLPLLIDVIQPTLRPVNIQLYSSREKAELAQLIRVMIGYNLTYQQQRNPDGQYFYKLEPNVDDIIRFTDIKPQRNLTYAAKQLISREVELERLRESNSKAESQSAASNLLQKPGGSSTGSVKGSGGEGAASLPNHLRQSLQPKKIVNEIKPAVDFFGRRIQKPEETPTEGSSKKADEVVGGDIWFRFKEGFTNADDVKLLLPSEKASDIKLTCQIASISRIFLWTCLAKRGEYARRRIKDGFRANISATDKSQIEKLLKSAQSNLDVIKRQVVVGNLYKDSTLVIENSLKKKSP